jgi:sulfofructose kinase
MKRAICRKDVTEALERQAGREFDVLVIGRACVDYISVVERFPVEDSKVPLEERLTEGGGQGATSACCISRLGGKVCYYGSVGDDDGGRFCIERLKHFGVDTSRVKMVEGGTTPVAYVFITQDTACRTIIYERSCLPPVGIDEEIPALLEKACVLLLDPQVTYLASRLKGFDKLPVIVYDCERPREGIEDMMRIADFFIPSAEFFSSAGIRIDGSTLIEKIRSLSHMVSGTLVMTAGEQGAYYVHQDRIYQVLPPHASITDTTGAGDNFHAAFALAVSRGFCLKDSVRFSVAVATLSCRAYGGREGVPDFEEAYRVMQCLEELVVSGS